MIREFLHGLEQGTEEWLVCRLGRVTASEFGTVLAKGKGSGESKTRRTYMLKLIGERLTGEIAESYANGHMERGKAMEAEARSMYEMMMGVDVQQVGFVTLGSEIGCSPDGLLGTGVLEIKTKLPHLHLDVLIKGEMPAEHIAQVQGQLWVCDLEWVDFVSYWPKLPIFTKRIYRDEEYIKNLSEEVDKFLDELHGIMVKIKKAA